MFASGSARNYLLYAIGEIALVVIGILIALQINNWNEAQRERNVEKQYILSLIDDLDGQIKVCKDQITFEIFIGKIADEALQIVQNADLFNQLDSLQGLLQTMVRRRTFTMFDPTFQDLKSTGNLKLIQNQNIRKTVILYYHALENRSRVIALNNLDLDNNYKMAVIQNKFGFYYDDNGELKNTKMRNPEHRQMTFTLIDQKKNVSSVHVAYVRELLVKTQNLQHLLKNATKDKALEEPYTN